MILVMTRSGSVPYSSTSSCNHEACCEEHDGTVRASVDGRSVQGGPHRSTKHASTHLHEGRSRLLHDPCTQAQDSTCKLASGSWHLVVASVPAWNCRRGCEQADAHPQDHRSPEGGRLVSRQRGHGAGAEACSALLSQRQLCALLLQPAASKSCHHLHGSSSPDQASGEGTHCGEAFENSYLNGRWLSVVFLHVAIIRPADAPLSGRACKKNKQHPKGLHAAGRRYALDLLVVLDIRTRIHLRLARRLNHALAASRRDHLCKL